MLSASPSTSSAISTTSFLPLCANFSSIGKNSCTLEIFLSVIKIAGFSYTASWRPVSVTKNGLAQPLSKLNPSTTSASISSPCPASTVITASRPTLPKISFASSLPISASPAEIVATSATRSLLPSMLSASLSRFLIISAPACSMPRRSSIGLCPAAMRRFASFKIEYVNTVTVVVPSPACLFRFFAACLMRSAPTL